MRSKRVKSSLNTPHKSSAGRVTRVHNLVCQEQEKTKKSVEEARKAFTHGSEAGDVRRACGSGAENPDRQEARQEALACASVSSGRMTVPEVGSIQTRCSLTN